ncbi:MAG TPA: ABC transporter permease [Deltaproteobacteria bacterium]|nr:ABC transporter permease [Deltaproteobacteria bacterium]
MGAASSLLYAAQSAVQGLRENLVTTFLTAVTVGFALAIFAFFLVVFVNVNSMLEAWSDRTHIVVYLDDGAVKDVEALKKKVAALAGVVGVRYVSKVEALAALKEDLEGHEELLDGVGPDALPASLEVKLDAESIESGGLERVVSVISGFDWAADVQYGAEWAERFASIVRFVEGLALWLGVFLLAAAVFIISNTIRLTVYARREEIEIMRLIGASARFIRVPFLIEGIVQGLMGGAAAALMLLAARRLLSARIPAHFAFVLELPVGAAETAVLLAAAGVILGAAGSVFSLGRFLKV